MASSEHVHFEVDEDEPGHSNDVVIKEAGSGRIDVHLGFLQVFHVYHIQFTVPVKEGHVQVKDTLVPSLNCRVLELKPG